MALFSILPKAYIPKYVIATIPMSTDCMLIISMNELACHVLVLKCMPNCVNRVNMINMNIPSLLVTNNTSFMIMLVLS